MNEVYVVKRGDTLWGISNQYGVNVSELASLNNVTAETLQVGQQLLIPSKSGTNPDNMFMYTVKKGDSLYSIARVYNTSVSEIKRINNLVNNNLYIGQVLRIPEMYTKPSDMNDPNYVNYTVKSGDSLYSIAKKYGVSVDTIIQDNALKNNILSIGQNLKIRSSSTIVEECFGEDYEIPSASYSNYIVKKGDSLYAIAKKFNISVSEIIKVNNLTTNNLSIGQVLKIPSNSDNTYTVVKGDSLYSIAKKFNTTVDSIKSKNNLTSNNLSVGQILKI
ncbi:MAG: LysM peptidoglycan-binding domain-containing protein [Bacilli bacterium]|nr:LysM peptidoglycan-binding domain-containing protein [Bacilli bacterium]